MVGEVRVLSQTFYTYGWYPQFRAHKEGGETSSSSVAGGHASYRYPPRHIAVIHVLLQTHQQESGSRLVPKRHGAPQPSALGLWRHQQSRAGAEDKHLPLSQASAMSSGRGRGGSCDFPYPISMPSTWSLPPILSLAVELALGWVGWGTQDLSSLQLAALPSLWGCLCGKERTETRRPEGSGLICHSINTGRTLV